MYQKVAVDKRKDRKSYIYHNSLKRCMEASGITITGLATLSGISETTIKQVRQHRQEPLQSTKDMLCRALLVDAKEVFPMYFLYGPAKGHSGNRYVRKG